MASEILLRAVLLGGPAGPTSVDVQHGLAADAAAEQGADRLGGLPPGAFQFDLGVEAAGGWRSGGR